jgi:hypothetical protein
MAWSISHNEKSSSAALSCVRQQNIVAALTIASANVINPP